jgi:hypothetical protein
MADAAPTRDPASRFAIRASVLVMMLVSMSAQASAKGLNEVSHSARVALQARLIADRILPAQTQEGLARGIRFAAIDCPLTQTTSATGFAIATDRETPAVRLLRDDLLNLPPPAC